MGQNNSGKTVRTPFHCGSPKDRATTSHSQFRPVPKFGAIGGLAMFLWANSAAAQVVIPYGDFDNDFEKYLVVAITLAALAFAVWRYFRKGR